MKLMTEVTIQIKKGFLPHFANELYKRNCEMQSLKVLDSNSESDLFFMEIVYVNKIMFREVIDKISRHQSNFRIISVKSVLEDKINGGLLNLTGKMQIENEKEYEMKVLGAVELILNRLNGEGAVNFTGLSKNIGLFYCYRKKEDFRPEKLMEEYTLEERDSIIIGRFTGFNAFPIIIRYDNIEDIIMTIHHIENTFKAVRIMEIEDVYDLSAHEQVCSELRTPVLSRPYDELPLFLITAVTNIMNKNKFEFSETTIGLIGTGPGAQRTTRLLVSMGCSRVLGYDINEKVMLSFEREGGLATTLENIFTNADIIILFNNQFAANEIGKIRPGQIIVSLFDEKDIDLKILARKGIKEHIYGRQVDQTALMPGMLRGVIEHGLHNIDDRTLISLARKISSITPDGTYLPGLFSDIHDRLPEYIRESLSI
jgi:hypothetical protein